MAWFKTLDLLFYGMAMTFSVLLLFYGLIKVLMRLD